MKILTYIIAIPVAFVLVLLAVNGVNAVSSDIKLDENQTVIVDKPIDGDGVKQIGDSGYYVTTVANLKNNQTDEIKIFPILDYKTELLAVDAINEQAYLDVLGAETFWDNVPDASGQVVAVIDGGFALSHEDMVDRWAINSLEKGVTATEGAAPNCTSRALPLDKSCNNIDDDSNGYIDDWRGWDFIQTDNDPSAGSTDPTADGVNHGVVVAGLIGVTGNNSIGTASLNWQSKIMPLQIFSDEGNATSLELYEAIAYAIDQGVDVINLSLGTADPDSFIDALLEEARDAGIVVVAAAGNCGGSSYALNGCDYEGQMLYPATSEYVISVGATDMNDIQADFSSRSALLDVTAPGSGLIVSSDFTSTNEIDAYTSEAYGTSFATPIVSGLMAILRAEWPSATYDDLRAILVDSANKPSGMAGNLFTSRYGFGRIDPVSALAKANICKIILLDSDYNCDDNVNLLDLSLLASQWQKQYTGRTDSNSSGLVDLLDLSLLASQWGQ
jgi:subtilisin family serine protease